MECTTGRVVCASHHPSLKATWDPPSGPPMGHRDACPIQPHRHEQPHPGSRGAAGSSHALQPPSCRQGRLLVVAAASVPPGTPREPQHALPSAGPSTPRPGAAEARGSPPAGSRADRLTWMGHRSRRAARQLRLHRLSRPRRARACLPAGQGPELAMPGCRLRGPGWDPHRPPARTQP